RTRAVTTTNIRASGTTVGNIIALVIRSQAANAATGGAPFVPSRAPLPEERPSLQGPGAPATTSAATSAQHVPATTQRATAGSRPAGGAVNARISAREPERALDGVVAPDRDVGQTVPAPVAAEQVRPGDEGRRSRDGGERRVVQ